MLARAHVGRRRRRRSGGAGADLRRLAHCCLRAQQNASAALEIADRGYVMETGRIVSTGEGSVLLSDPKVKAAYLGAD